VTVNANGTTLAKGVTSWQQDKSFNRTAYQGPSGNCFVADFAVQTTYHLDNNGACQYYCQMSGFDQPCSSTVNAAPLCGTNYETAVFEGTEIIGGVNTNRFKYTVTDLSWYKIWFQVDSNAPVQWFVDYSPMGIWGANATATYDTFSNGTPPAANFAFTGIDTCYPGTDDECSNGANILAMHMATSDIPTRKQPKILLKDN